MVWSWRPGPELNICGLSASPLVCLWVSISAGLSVTQQVKEVLVGQPGPPQAPVTKGLFTGPEHGAARPPFCRLERERLEKPPEITVGSTRVETHHYKQCQFLVYYYYPLLFSHLEDAFIHCNLPDLNFRSFALISVITEQGRGGLVILLWGLTWSPGPLVWEIEHPSSILPPSLGPRRVNVREVFQQTLLF